MTYAHKHILTHKSAGERERGYCGERERECERERERELEKTDIRLRRITSNDNIAGNGR